MKCAFHPEAERELYEGASRYESEVVAPAIGDRVSKTANKLLEPMYRYAECGHSAMRVGAATGLP